MVQTLMILVLTITTLGLATQNMKLREESQFVGQTKVQPEFSGFVGSYLQSYQIQAKLQPQNLVLKQKFGKIEVTFSEVVHAAPNQPFKDFCEKKNGKLNISLKVPRETWNYLNVQQRQAVIDHTFNDCINRPSSETQIGKANGVII